MIAISYGLFVLAFVGMLNYISARFIHSHLYLLHDEFGEPSFRSMHRHEFSHVFQEACMSSGSSACKWLQPMERSIYRLIRVLKASFRGGSKLAYGFVFAFYDVEQHGKTQ